MPQTPCSFNYFEQGSSVTVNNSQQVLPIVAKTINDYLIDNATRPFIPYVGLQLDASGAYKPVSVASNQNNKNTFYDWFKGAWFASRNYALDDFVDQDQIIGGSDNYYASYLFKRLEGNLAMQNRFLQIGSLIWDFWNNADPAWTASQYQTALQQFQVFLELQADFNLYLAPALYDFGNAAPGPNDSGLGADIKAWQIADVNFVAFGAIELYV